MEDNKFKQDVADPDININKLNDIFNILETGEVINGKTGEVINVDSHIASEVKEMRKELNDIEESLPDVDDIIMKNIDRANRFLDTMEEQILNGNMSASMLESCATLINAVTSAATSITGISYNNDVIEIRREELRIREKKITLDSMKGQQTPGVVEGDVNIIQNTITMTREELLDEFRK